MPNNLFPKPDPWRPGWQKVSARQLQQMMDAIFRQVEGDGTVVAKQYGDRLVLSAREEERLGATEPELMLFSVIEEFDDFLLCNPFWYNFGETPVPVQVYDPNLPHSGPFVLTDARVCVAKPSILQKTMWNGQSVTMNYIAVVYTYTGIGVRKASGVIGGVAHTETQYITPSYYPGDIITARYGPTQLTAPVDPGAPTGSTGPMADIVWTDNNEGSRMWAWDGLS
jgi:hypothetical protein